MVACVNSECGFDQIPEGAKGCPMCLTPLPTAPNGERSQRQRRPVTIVYCDVHHSTDLAQQLDVEALGARMERFAEVAREVFARHSGRTGTRQGDGLMAVFGIPGASDDDAVRAVRAAAELRDALAPLAAELERDFGLPFAVRMGINTGQVLVRLDRDKADRVEEQVEGAEVALAKRLEEHAGPGEILIGEETYQLVRDAIHTTGEFELELDGFREKQRAWRLGEVYRGRPGRIPRLHAPLVGRQHELAVLDGLFEMVADEPTRHLVTLLGEAGVGKTRLAMEFVEHLGDRATNLRAHCLSYGEGVTYWPVKEIVLQAVGMAELDSATGGTEQVTEQLPERLAELFSEEERDRQALTTIKQLFGLGDGETSSPGDTSLALRRLLENLALRKPLVVLIDDLHLAEEPLLDAIEQIAEAGREVPIMLLCLARPDELFDKRRIWPRGWTNSTTLTLLTLKKDEGEQLFGHLLRATAETVRATAPHALPTTQLGDQELAHLIRLAQGNPLTIEELVAWFAGKGWLRVHEGRLILTPDVYRYMTPPPVNQILQSRLDKLKDEERKVIERAAVVGEQFHAIDVEALSLAADPVEVAARLDALVRHQIIQPDQTIPVTLTSKGSEGYRFRHILMRQAVYDRMSLPLRADLHERYADWLEQAAGREGVGQVADLIATHLYEAYNYLHSQRLPAADERMALLGRRAGEYFAVAGRQAALRGDVQIAVTLLDRAVQLLPADHPDRLAALPDLAEALQARGELKRAMGVYEEIRQAAAAGDGHAGVNATLGLLYAQAFAEPETFLRDGQQEVERLLPGLEGRHDQPALAKATFLLAYLDYATGRSEEARVKAERARELARRAGDKRLEASIVRLLCVLLYWGPAHVDEVERYIEEALDLARRADLGNLEAGTLTIAARIQAMRGDFARARRLSRQAERINTDLGELLTQAADTITDGVIGLLAGELGAAEAALRRGYESLDKMGGAGPKANVASWLARVLLRQGRLDEAERMTEECERCAASAQTDAQAKWRSIRAVVLARRHQREAAEKLVKDALELVDGTDQPDTQAEVHADYAEVLRLAGRRQEAERELRRAAYLYAEKGNLSAAKQISGLLAELH
jgi:predicted ATPase/class 3 adenylate cyclase